jgi:anti-anti-sigma factor
MVDLKTRTRTLRIEAAGQPRGAVLRCAGAIDLSSVETLRQALAASMRAGLPAVEVDVSEIHYLDSEAIRVLLEARDQLSRVGTSLYVRIDPRAARMFHRLGLDRLLDIRAA